MTKRQRKVPRPTNSSEYVGVALNSPRLTEDLPLSVVNYPNHYGTFITFSYPQSDEQYFCECAIPALDNYFTLHEITDGFEIYHSLSEHDFNASLAGKSKFVKELSNLFKFKPRICHRCNLKTPTIRYCIEMYGSSFKQFFGWYINQNQYKLGFSKFFSKYLPDKCPDELHDLVTERQRLLKDIEENRYTWEMEKRKEKITRTLNNEIENLTRQEFGFRKIGDGFVTETLLYSIIKNIFPTTTIIRHHRPEWLNRLELDVFLPDLNLAFEYQGQQHFHPVDAWGGKTKLLELVERDKLKRTLCQSNNITLIEIDYTEPMTEKYIKEKLKKASR